jgi:ribonuclease HI
MPRRRYIVKVDGSYCRDGESGVGIVIIDRYKGRHYFNIKTNCKNSLQCERIAVLYALRKLNELNINSDIAILCDNRNVVTNFHKQYKHKKKDISFSWIPREKNRTAHQLARKAAKNEFIQAFVPKQILELEYK